MSEELLYEKDGALVVLTINRPAERNLLGRVGDGVLFEKAADRIQADSEVRCADPHRRGPRILVRRRRQGHARPQRSVRRRVRGIARKLPQRDPPHDPRPVEPRRAADRGRQRTRDRPRQRRGLSGRYPPGFRKGAVRTDVSQARPDSGRRRRLDPAAIDRLFARRAAIAYRPAHQRGNGEGLGVGQRSHVAGRTAAEGPRTRRRNRAAAARGAAHGQSNCCAPAGRTGSSRSWRCPRILQGILQRTHDHDEAVAAFFEKRPPRFAGE